MSRSPQPSFYYRMIPARRRPKGFQQRRNSVAHIVGTVLPVSPQVVIGPDSGLPPTSPNTWAFDLDPGPPPAGGIKFIIVHLQNLNITGNNRVEIDLGYDKDVITATTDSEFWSRPVN